MCQFSAHVAFNKATHTKHDNDDENVAQYNVSGACSEASSLAQIELILYQTLY